MTGSSLAPILIPIVGTISLTAWLILVSSADSHPSAGDYLAPGRGSAVPVVTDQHQPHACRAGQGDSAGTGCLPDANTAQRSFEDHAAAGASRHQPGPIPDQPIRRE